MRFMRSLPLVEPPLELGIEEVLLFKQCGAANGDGELTWEELCLLLGPILSKNAADERRDAEPEVLLEQGTSMALEFLLGGGCIAAEQQLRVLTHV